MHLCACCIRDLVRAHVRARRGSRVACRGARVVAHAGSRVKYIEYVMFLVRLLFGVVGVVVGGFEWWLVD